MNMPFTFTKRNLVFLLICLGGVTLLVLVSIVPLMATRSELSQKIPEVRQRLDEQGKMVLILTTIDNKLSGLEKLEKLPGVANQSLAITESNSVIDHVKDLAGRENLTDIDTVAIMPDSSINLKELTFSTSAKGSLTDIRSCIFSLLQVPYVATIKKITIRSDDEVLQIEMLFTVRLS